MLSAEIEPVGLTASVEVRLPRGYSSARVAGYSYAQHAPLLEFESNSACLGIIVGKLMTPSRKQSASQGKHSRLKAGRRLACWIALCRMSPARGLREANVCGQVRMLSIALECF